jgi:hypothetical protein
MKANAVCFRETFTDANKKNIQQGYAIFHFYGVS